MRNLLGQVYKFIMSYDDVQRQMGNYERAMKTEEWKFLKDVILVIRSEMAKEYFSKSFTTKTPEEKDIIQKTYYHVNEILDFLLSPVGWVKKRTMKDPTRLGGNIPTQRREGNGTK